MILTVTPNSSVDCVLFIEEFQPGTDNRPHKMILSVGGKALDASVVLQTLGVENVALSFTAGATGQQLVNLLDNYGIKHDLVQGEGQTRTANVLVETKYHRHSHITTPGYSVPPEAYQSFIAKCRHYLPDAKWVVAGGSLPSGVPITFYRTLTEMARQHNVPILLDVPGRPLVEALPAKPDIIKINEAEFSQTFNIQFESTPDLITKVRNFREEHQLSTLVLTCGADGIFAFTPDGTYQAVAPPQQAVNAAGAGDSVSAVLPWRLSLGDTWPQTVRRAAATSAAVVLTEGTADVRPADVERIWLDTKVRRV
jgi:1-phosphofructokinase family hexose kinase